MSTLRWTGNAQANAQIDTLTPADVGIGDAFTATINGKSITVVATAATVANITGLMTTAWNASDIAEFSEITAVDSTTEITLTHDTQGVPFTLTSSASGGTATFTQATTTAAAGPNFANLATNWDTGSTPIDGDTVYLDNSAISILYGLGMSSIDLAALYISPSFTGAIGLPKTNPNGYPDYRGDYWAISATSLINRSTSSRIKINTGTVQTALEIINAGSGSESNLESFLWKGTHASNTVEVNGGSLGIAAYGGEAATVLTLTVNNGTVRCGSGITLATINQNGGTLKTESAFTTLNQNGGTHTQAGSGAITTLNVSGTLNYNSTGTVTAVNVNAGTIDCSLDSSARTFTTTTVKKGGRIIDPARSITHTNKIALGTDATRVSVD